MQHPPPTPLLFRSHVPYCDTYASALLSTSFLPVKYLFQQQLFRPTCYSACEQQGCDNCGNTNAGTTTSPRICTKNMGRCDSASCTCDSGFFKETVVPGCWACRRTTTAKPKETTTGWWQTTARAADCAAPARSKSMGYLKACECKSPNKIVGSGAKASTFW